MGSIMGKVRPSALLQRAKQQRAEAAGKPSVPVKGCIALTLLLLGAILFLRRTSSPLSTSSAAISESQSSRKHLMESGQQGATGEAREIGKKLPKVLLKTSLGDIVVELYADDCPKTVENFLTHSKNKYYKGIIFHRVIPGFMIQGGDPTGTGRGGESIWGGSFKDEIRPHLKHEPFTLSMANAGPDSNGSQFFITTVATPHLNGHHTVFGLVIKGKDVVQAIENVQTDSSDRPITAVTILDVEVDPDTCC
ncbi:unnamed protein product [Closterium sp. NIES-53]